MSFGKPKKYVIEFSGDDKYPFKFRREDSKKNRFNFTFQSKGIRMVKPSRSWLLPNEIAQERWSVWESHDIHTADLNKLNAYYSDSRTDSVQDNLDSLDGFRKEAMGKFLDIDKQLREMKANGATERPGKYLMHITGDTWKACNRFLMVNPEHPDDLSDFLRHPKVSRHCDTQTKADVLKEGDKVHFECCVGFETGRSKPGEEGIIISKKDGHEMLGIEFLRVYDYQGSGTVAGYSNYGKGGYTIYGKGLADDGIQLVNVKGVRRKAFCPAAYPCVTAKESEIASKSAVTKVTFADEQHPTNSLDKGGKMISP